MSTVTTRVFMNGNSQAVRIPQEFRIQASRVEISRNERGDLVLRPVVVDRGTALLDVLRGFDDDFIASLEQERIDPAPAQDREDL